MTEKFLKCTCAQCGGRIEFPAEGLGLTVPCPHCGWKTELAIEAPEQTADPSRRSLKWIIAGVVILVLGVFGVGGAFIAARHLMVKRAQRLAVQPVRPIRTNAPQIAKPPEAEAKAAVALEGFSASPVKIEKTSGSSLVYAAGTLKNETDRQRFGVTVELDLLDSAGKKIGTSKDYKDIIEPHAAWTFRASVFQKGISAGRIAAVQER